ncbi:helix-turn-helix transcriptional regulator [Pigmentiphaga sp. YJ18]|uniref:helix-turn-helix domain-containing protein n=1 Tax=Pigmentiphaga sp. YJ18 TaxID=3134907 RepID=UPI00310D2A53
MDTTLDLIKKLRAAGLSQSEIARRSGIPQPRISRWEGGATPTGADDALRLAQLAREVLDAQPSLAPEPTPAGEVA